MRSFEEAKSVQVDAMNAWARAAGANLEPTSPSVLRMLHDRLEKLGSFSHRVFPRVIHALPVLYMFSGSDLLTAHALFPNAPEYNLVADVPTGHPSCFTSPLCASRANDSASAFFKHWSNLRFARQSTTLMRKAFGTNEDGAFASAGQLGALLLSLQLMRQPIVYAATGIVNNASVVQSPSDRRHRCGRGIPVAAGVDQTNVSIPRVVLQTPRYRVVYHSLLMRSDTSERSSATKQFWPSMARWDKGGKFVDTQLQTLADSIAADVPSAVRTTGSSRRFVTMFKAAPHWILRNGWMARWVLERSSATLHDETGLRPKVYNETSSWETRHFGSFRDFENREVNWYPGERAELMKIFHDETTLPFQFGYAQRGGRGVLMVAWRKETER